MSHSRLSASIASAAVLSSLGAGESNLLSVAGNLYDTFNVSPSVPKGSTRNASISDFFFYIDALELIM
jgi:hypothetical protein